MARNETQAKQPHGVHSHSRIRKLLDELDAIVGAARSNGAYEAHHRRELEEFLGRLRSNFEQHADYEEGQLFEELRPTLQEDELETLGHVIDQHRRIADALDRVETLFDELSIGAPAETRPFEEFADAVSELQQLWARHDTDERRFLDDLPREDDD